VEEGRKPTDRTASLCNLGSSEYRSGTVAGKVEQVGPEREAVRTHEERQLTPNPAVAAPDEPPGADVQDVGFRLVAVSDLVAAPRKRVDLEVRIFLVEVVGLLIRQAPEPAGIRSFPAGEQRVESAIHQAAENCFLMRAAAPRRLGLLGAGTTADESAVADTDGVKLAGRAVAHFATVDLPLEDIEMDPGLHRASTRSAPSGAGEVELAASSGALRKDR